MLETHNRGADAVPRDDWNADEDEDEDWTDDIDDPDADDDVDPDDESAICPECGGHMFLGADKCPACGYWLTAADRRTLGTDSSQPQLIKIVAIVILAIMLVTMLITGIRMF
jgi:hypothetical protein